MSEYINEKTPFRGLLVWHGLGSGKTCASIASANTFKNTNVKLIAPAALVNNFKIDYKKCGDPELAQYIRPAGDKTPLPKGAETKLVDCYHKKCDLSTESTQLTKIKDSKFVYYSSNGQVNSYNSKLKSLYEKKLIIIYETKILKKTINKAIIYR